MTGDLGTKSDPQAYLRFLPTFRLVTESHYIVRLWMPENLILISRFSIPLPAVSPRKHTLTLIIWTGQDPNRFSGIKSRTSQLVIFKYLTSALY